MAKVWEGKGGKYLFNWEVSPHSAGNDVMFHGGFAKHAYDPGEENRLRKVSAECFGA